MMDFQEFGNKINSDDKYKEEYFKDPVMVVQRDLGITLTESQQKQLRQAAKDIKQYLPGHRLYIPGSKVVDDETNDKPVFH